MQKKWRREEEGGPKSAAHAAHSRPTEEKRFCAPTRWAQAADAETRRARRRKGREKRAQGWRLGEQRRRSPSATLRTSSARPLENAAGEKREQLLMELDHLGNGPDMMGPESTGSQACLQWAHWTSRAAESLAPEWVSNATEFLLWQ